MTRADKFEEIFGYRPATDQVLCNEHDYCGESDACNYCMCNPNNIGRAEDWWNAEYKEPTTKNDLGVDCISRADAIQAMQDKTKKLTNEDTINGLCGAVAILFDLPSVTPQPRKGHWISHGEHCEMNNLRPSGLGSYFWCSKCDRGIDSKNFSRVNYNYCPNCGADMREKEEKDGIHNS